MYSEWSQDHQREYWVNAATGEVTEERPVGRTLEDNYNAAAHQHANDNVGNHVRRYRRENNMVKRELIESVPLPQDARVLDIACGKGGDLLKWQASGRVRQYMGIDTSAEAVREAYARAQDISFRSNFTVLDARRDVHWEREFGGRFDVVSCQFGLHYFFSSRETAEHVMQRIGSSLESGGTFIATFPDANAVRQIARGERGAPEYVRIQFINDHSYSFTLAGSVHDVVEHLVDWNTFLDVSECAGLQVNTIRRFGGMYLAVKCIKV